MLKILASQIVTVANNRIANCQGVPIAKIISISKEAKVYSHQRRLWHYPMDDEKQGSHCSAFTMLMFTISNLDGTKWQPLRGEGRWT